MTSPSRKYHHLESTFSWGYRIDGWRQSSHLAPTSRELGEVCISTTYGDCLERWSAMGPCTFLLGIPRMYNCDTLYLSHLFRLWLPSATLKDEIASLPGQGAGLFLLAAEAVNPPSSVILCLQCNPLHVQASVGCRGQGWIGTNMKLQLLLCCEWYSPLSLV